jgi:hypothetical protein
MKKLNNIKNYFCQVFNEKNAVSGQEAGWLPVARRHPKTAFRVV